MPLSNFLNKSLAFSIFSSSTQERKEWKIDQETSTYICIIPANINKMKEREKKEQYNTCKTDDMSKRDDRKEIRECQNEEGCKIRKTEMTRTGRRK